MIFEGQRSNPLWRFWIVLSKEAWCANMEAPLDYLSFFVIFTPPTLNHLMYCSIWLMPWFSQNCLWNKNMCSFQMLRHTLKLWSFCYWSPLWQSDGTSSLSLDYTSAEIVNKTELKVAMASCPCLSDLECVYSDIYPQSGSQ